jgi:hypothetical protein
VGKGVRPTRETRREVNAKTLRRVRHAIALLDEVRATQEAARRFSGTHLIPTARPRGSKAK